MPSLVLYVDATYSSPYAMFVYVTLLEKKLEFELKTIDLAAGEHQKPPYRDLALTGKVPMLVHDGHALTESSAIIEYLEEVFPAPGHARVLPADPFDRARARQVQAWLRSDMLALRTERTTEVIFYKPSPTPLSADGKADAERLVHIAERLVHGEHLFGEWSIADTELTLMLQRLWCNGYPLPERIADYIGRQWQRPSVVMWLGQPRGRG